MFAVGGRSRRKNCSLFCVNFPLTYTCSYTLINKLYNRHNTFIIMVILPCTVKPLSKGHLGTSSFCP